MLLFGILGATLLAVLALAVRPSHAAVGDLVFTIEAPGVQESQVTCNNGSGVETFDGFNPDYYGQLAGSIGDHSVPLNAGDDIAVFVQASTGGAEVPALPTNFASTDRSYLLTLDQPAGYFGFWWSAGDGSNKVTVNMADGSSQVFTTQSILNSGALQGSPGGGLDGHYGNPTAAYSGQVDGEVFAFVNIFASDPNAKIVSLLFEEAQGGQGQFESDNHTVCADILDPNSGTPIPQTGSVTIVKEANPESEQEFDFLTNVGGPFTPFQLKDNGIDDNTILFDGLTPSVWDFTEQPTAGWSLKSIECSGGADIVIREELANIQVYLSGGEEVRCTFTNNEIVSLCRAGPNVGSLRTDVYGTGKRGRSAKVTLPNYQDVDSLYGQLAAVDIGIMKFVRFSVKSQPRVQVNNATSPAGYPSTVRWWGADLEPGVFARGTFYWGKKGNRSPRAFVVWPTYNTTDEYANVFETFDDSGTNFVHWASIPLQEQTLSIPETQAAGADVTVEIALVDVNKDSRSVILTVEAGGVSEQRVITVPNRKDSLNLETFVLEGVAAGTSKVKITLQSPGIGGQFPFGGDSAAIIGAAVSYPCEVPAP